MKKDWKQTAAAWNLPIPAEDLEKIIPSLDGLEAGFRPLANSLDANTESAMIYKLLGPVE